MVATQGAATTQRQRQRPERLDTGENVFQKVFQNFSKLFKFF
jgi:hypothetical protein